jgi:hypothetical protein
MTIRVPFPAPPGSPPAEFVDRARSFNHELSTRLHAGTALSAR